METPEIPKVDGRLAQAISHPVRVAFLRLLAGRESLSPKEAAREIRVGGEVPLSQVGYHTTVLERFGVIELVGRPGHKGGASFRATDTGELLMLAIGPTPGGNS